MPIDAHQHFWHYDAARFGWITEGMDVLKRDWLPDDLLAQLQATGTEGTVAVQATASESETGFLLDLARRYRWIRGVVGWVDLARPDVGDRIAGYRDHPALVGFRHQLQDEPQYMGDAAFNDGVREVQRQSLVYEVLLFHQQLQDGVGFCRRHADHWLVIDHLAKPAIGGAPALFATWKAAMTELAAMPHVAAKVSGLVTEAPPGLPPHVLSESIVRHLDVALELFGEDRLLFGSDWPVCLLATTYQDWHHRIDQWLRDKGATLRDKFLGGNARLIYSLADRPQGGTHGS